jgi:hypothetical protein
MNLRAHEGESPGSLRTITGLFFERITYSMGFDITGDPL